MNLIFDLDGTLLDSRRRLFVLFQSLVPEASLSFTQYWRIKREGVSNEEILRVNFNFDSKAVDQFAAAWAERVEDADFLMYDRPIPGLRPTLARLRRGASLHVCTARKRSQPVLDQLDRWGLLPFFHSVLITGQVRGKDELMRRIEGLAPSDWVFSDTGDDIAAGNSLGIQTCGVLSGVRNKSNLETYNPTLILHSVCDFLLEAPRRDSPASGPYS